MADALDSGSSEVTLVWVQLPSSARIENLQGDLNPCNYAVLVRRVNNNKRPIG